MKELLLVLTLGTATPGGGFPVYGDALAEIVNAQEPRLRIETRNTKGSSENVPLLDAGSYPGQDAPLASVGSWSFVLCSERLPEETACLLARAELIHPRVRMYLREAGVLR